MRRSPVVETLAVMVAVFAAQTVLWVVGAGGLLALSADVAARPWALVTTVYAHASPGHLVSNAVALVVVGLIVGRNTTRPRFHAFFLGTGALAAAAEVAVGTALGRPPLVLGASGAVFALAGYALTGNAVASALLDRLVLSPRAKVVGLLVVVAGLTLLTGTGRAALVAHATGLTAGMIAGRAGVLAAPGAGGGGAGSRSRAEVETEVDVDVDGGLDTDRFRT